MLKIKMEKNDYFINLVIMLNFLSGCVELSVEIY